MSIESNMLDAGMNLDGMTAFESKCYGMSEADIRAQYMNSLTASFCGLEMVVMGILSDCQEMMTMGTGPRSVEYVRKQMNVAKFILAEMQDIRENKEMVLVNSDGNEVTL